MRQTLGHAAGRRSVVTHPGWSLLPVTVARPGLFMDLGHWHLYPDGSQFPVKKSRTGQEEPCVLILTNNMTLNKLGPFSAGLAHLQNWQESKFDHINPVLTLDCNKLTYVLICCKKLK